jgi:hypothetical protein
MNYTMEALAIDLLCLLLNKEEDSLAIDFTVN